MGIYNCEKYLEQAIASIVRQTYKNWELIMCDDGSTDGTYQTAKEIAKNNNKIILIKNKRNLGLNKTLNKCLKLARGEYIARQDADDISIPMRLEKELDFLTNNKEYAFCSCNMILFDESGQWGQVVLEKFPQNNNFINGTPFAHAPALIRKSVLDEVGGYTIDERLIRVEDYHLWAKIYVKGYKGANLQEPLYLWRDDRNAYKRRTWTARKNEVYARLTIYKMLKLPKLYYPLAYAPLLKAIIPEWLYKKIRGAKRKK